MKIANISAILSSPELAATAAADGAICRLAQIASALNCALAEASTVDAERQLHKLVWLLCARSGGDICRPADALKAACNRTHQCACGRVEDTRSIG